MWQYIRVSWLVTGKAGTAYACRASDCIHPLFMWVIIAQSLVFCVVSCRSLFVLSSLFFLPYHYPSFVDLRIFIILLISSNVSLIIVLLLFSNKTRVITKLPNSEQSNKGKVKTHKYINKQNQSATGKLWKP